MRIRPFPWALAAALLASCADYDVPDSVLFGEAVFTQPAPDATFGGRNLSYHLYPTYRMVDGEQTPPRILDISLDTVPQVKAAIIDNMETVYGYTPVPDSGDPNTPPDADVVLNVTVIKGNVSVYYPGYWCDYWYYYSCWYNWYYAGSYDVGSAVLEMGDLRAAGEALPILWTGVVYGVASTGITDQQRVASGIDRAYAQSPYLKTN